MRAVLILSALLAIFVVHCLFLDFTQDDAFISFRYVKNFVSGEGLVFNSGERVEGYTNFFWILLLSLFLKLGFDLVIVSKILGVICGTSIIVLVYLLSCRYIDQRRWYLRFIAPAFLVANSAFAYWSISGLETTFFALMVLLSLWVYLHKRKLAMVFLALSSLIRPEGILVFLIFLLYKLFVEKDSLKECAIYLGGFALLLLPHFVFRYSYYRDFLPNPFYAKVGLSWESLKNGLEYFWLFLRHYGFWGILYLIPLYLYKRSDNLLKLFAWIIFIYTLYIIAVGGDVLKAHRFFVPILPFLLLLFGKMVFDLFLRFKSRLSLTLLLGLLVCLGVGLTFFLPRNWIWRVRSLEQALVDKMEFIAESLRADFGSDLTLTVSTIGALAYHSPDSRVIDMLGLTDREISKHPDYLPGIPASWKERKYNAAYILSQDPDFIIFSTGSKPSAPAERALFLYSQFRQNYYVSILLKNGGAVTLFTRKGQYQQENRIFEDARFVDLYNEALNHSNAREWWESRRRLERVLEICPDDFAWGYEEMGRVCCLVGDFTEAKKYLLQAIKIDDYCVTAHGFLADIYLNEGDYGKALQEYETVNAYNPGLTTVETQIAKLKDLLDNQKEEPGQTH